MTIINVSIALPVLLSLLVGFLAYNFFTLSSPLPRGPTPKLLSGNVHQLPKSEPWKTYKKWSETYGPIIMFRVFRRKIVVLNTFKSAFDLLESGSNIYSDRPQAWMYKELVGRKLAVFNIFSDHPRFKVYRKLLHSGLNTRAIQNYHVLLGEEVQKLLGRLARAPDDFIVHLRQNAGTVVLKLAYGWTVRGSKDRFVTLMEEAPFVLSQITKPGQWLIDDFPILRFVPGWFPGAGFKRKAEEYKSYMNQVDVAPFAWAKEQIASGSYVPSFTSQYLLPEDGHVPDAEEEDIIKWCSGALYGGGADTTVAFMTAFFVAMTMNPEVQKSAQAEIDTVVGSDRKPRCEDQKNLPYTSALIQEVLRWAPPAPLGLPHCVTEDDIYLGMRIPKGTTIMANIWAMAHDDSLYPDPFVFNPERFLFAEKHEPQLDPRKYVFGFGRRVCPGAQFIETAVFLNVANILATFIVCKALDSNFQEITPKIEFTTTITSHVKPFPCRIVPRFPEEMDTLLRDPEPDVHQEKHNVERSPM